MLLINKLLKKRNEILNYVYLYVYLCFHHKYLTKTSDAALFVLGEIDGSFCVKELLSLIIKEYVFVGQICFSLVILGIFQFFLWNFSNFRRKIFHIYFYLIFVIYTIKKLDVFCVFLHVFLILSCFCSKYIPETEYFLSFFVNENDVYKKVKSHNIFMLCILVIYEKYKTKYTSKKILIQMISPICILDTFTSISKDFKKVKEKTKYDFLLGICANILFNYMFTGETKFLFVVLCGVIEYFASFFDNIALTAFILLMY
ncbi:hypothetical protein EHP00_1337 [Ecytonucleospora hepatopenaei]|uniref:Dolichol kinase n=1 Tax=Ecytonucleospora hepatopenaei TaxID=646526 RepID=A0A1W0E6Z7_9MICR|nr:hypothetical protein EHP00_1337 [Ecytonucleospora hepatopenaei]